MPPSAIFLLPPGASLGADAQVGVLEIKGIGTAAVISFAEETVLLADGSSEVLRGFDHATIHSNLQVHVRGVLGKRELRPAVMTELGSAPHHLLTAGTGSVARPARRGRLQREWTGAAIFSFLEDERHVRERSQIIVDIWALGRDVTNLERLCSPVLPGLRPARSNSPPFWGPVPSSWAFEKNPPRCAFFFSFWVGEIEPLGRPFVAHR